MHAPSLNVHDRGLNVTATEFELAAIVGGALAH
jgi:hypothetical protein